MEPITLHTRSTTYQMLVSEHGFLLHLYYGPSATGDLSPLLTYELRGCLGIPYDNTVPNFSCDFLPQEYSCCGSGDYRNHAFRVRSREGVQGADLRYREHRFLPGKYAIPGLPASYGEEQVSTCEIVLEDRRLELEVILRYGVFYEDDVITRAVEVRNHGREALYLNKVMSGSIDFLTGQYDLIHFYGRHCNELHMERTPVGHSCVSIGSRRGVSSHQHNPFAILAQDGCGEENGACYGFSLMYSGNFLLQAEQDQYSQTRVQVGLSDEMLDYCLAEGQAFYAPELIMAYSDSGLTRLSHLYHHFIRRHVCRGVYQTVRRPILVNNWEATYFDFTGEKLLGIARTAAELGLEMLVLDDGWFGCRELDDRSLGDWVVNEDKLGCTLGELAEKVNALGLKFGLWIEPEMVNENSDLYRAHPDWAMRIPGKPPVLGRNQLVLDFSREEVREGILSQITRVLDSANVEYIKMDMNRSICEAYSTEGNRNFGELCHRYVLGVYDFIGKLQARYPHILFEGCSSGGGRFDAGMLYYTPQVWLSDNTEAIERLQIQYGASFGYPVSVMGSHVSAVPNHQNGRVTPLHTRGIAAMSGSFGYELDLTRLSDAEKEEIRRQIAAFTEDWELLHNGFYYRCSEPAAHGEFVAWCMVSPDGSSAILNAVTTNVHANSQIRYVRCRGLQDGETYRCRETGVCWPGSVLRSLGMPLPVKPGEYHAYSYHFDLQETARLRCVGTNCASLTPPQAAGCAASEQTAYR